jgi:hypothetical protein
MRWFSQLTMKIRMLFSRNKAATQLDDELRFHLDRQIDENIAAGMSADEARYAALRTFGNPASAISASASVPSVARPASRSSPSASWPSASAPMWPSLL